MKKKVAEEQNSCHSNIYYCSAFNATAYWGYRHALAKSI